MSTYKREQSMKLAPIEQLRSQHGVVGIFVVQLQDLNEVVEATLVLGVLAGLVHGVDLGLGQELGSLGATATNLLDGLHCRK